MTKGGLPPIVEQNARSAGTDVAGYITESPGFSAFVLEEGTVYQTYSTTWRGLEFVMTYYPILDQAPKGRDEGEAIGSSGSAATTSTNRYSARRQIRAMDDPDVGDRALAVSPALVPCNPWDWD